MSIVRLLRVSLTTADLAGAEAFYCGTLGFARAAGPADVDRGWLQAMGMTNTEARAVRLRLGAQELEIVAFDAPAQPYPAARAANDPWFQHVAIVVSDMAAAWERVRQAGITPISDGGPQRLPPNTGSVIAVKFRDPEGHPLELLQFPAGTGDPAWQRGAKGALFLGYDHSAIVVRDVAASVGFYTGLPGFSELSRSVNRGAEQERLDGLPDDVVDVVALRPAAEATPHLELLGYRTPPVAAAGSGGSVRDIAATRLVLEVDDLSGTTERLRAAGSAVAPPDGVPLPDGSRASLACDPDGHRLMLVQLS